jgi:hypothetical protein
VELREKFQLTESEFVSLHFACGAQMRIWEQMYLSELTSVRERDLAERDLRHNLGNRINEPFQRAWWSSVRASFDQEFVRFVYRHYIEPIEATQGEQEP